MKKVISVIVLSFGFLWSSCSINEEQQIVPPLDLTNMDLAGLGEDWGLGSKTYDLNEYPLDEIVSTVATLLDEIDYEKMAERMELSQDMEAYLLVGMKVISDSNIVVLSIEEGSRKREFENSRVLTDDSELCGGEEGDGWVSQGTCFSPECVSDMILAAADQMGEPGNGQCLDFRVQGLLVGVRVCARFASCN